MSNKIDIAMLDSDRKYVADFGYGVEILKGKEISSWNKAFGKFDLYEYNGFYNSCGKFIGTIC